MTTPCTVFALMLKMQITDNQALLIHIQTPDYQIFTNDKIQTPDYQAIISVHERS
jgi:hypothetical protein